MNREISMVTEIGVTLIAVSAVIGIIWFTVFLGNMMGNDVSVEASEIVSNMEVGALNDLCEIDTVLPTSAVYSILRTYSRYVPNFQNNLEEINEDNPMKISLQDLNTATPNIVQNMKGKVNLEVTKTDEGWYSVIVHHKDCSWFYAMSYEPTAGARCPICADILGIN